MLKVCSRKNKKQLFRVCDCVIKCPFKEIFFSSKKRGKSIVELRVFKRREFFILLG